MDSYRCKVCSHIYRPEEGDTVSGVEPNTPFEELPEEWVCPICGVGKALFERVDE